jgi:DNA-binding MarR family transcriptional regulator
MPPKSDKVSDLIPAEDIDRIIHQPARLNILAHLFVVSCADFLFLLRQTGLTKGNLSAHLSKLESAGYVSVEKKFVDKIPRTIIRLTARGRKAFQLYKDNMIRVLDELPK